MAAFMSSRWLLPKGLLVESISLGADGITVAARSATSEGICPSCRQRSRRVHSRYGRTLADLPCSGRVLQIGILVRRFRCTMAACPTPAARHCRRGPLRPPHVQVRSPGATPRAGFGRPSLLRTQTNAAITRLAKGGLAIKAIVRRTGCSRKTVRQVLRGERSDMFRCRTSSLEPWLHLLDREWATGCRNGAELWRRLQIQGFRGSLRAVGEWVTRRRRSGGASPGGLERTPSARRLARLMLLGRTQLARAEAVLVATIESALPSLAKARELALRFQALIRGRKGETLATWIAAAKASPLASFAAGIQADRNAVAAAIVEPWSNGQTEGQITKLKLVKRQMYGRAKLDLLRARLVIAG